MRNQHRKSGVLRAAGTMPGSEPNALGKSQRACPVHPNRSEADDKKPPKENPEHPLAVLMRVRNRLEYLANEIANLNWKENDPGDYQVAISAITNSLRTIQQGVTK
ncbi:MAG: hypothetical protein ABSG53_15600 [Thermoguttaceae bacterium]|jgi:hypothetical protein